jgi:replicative DNA helicase
MTAEIITMRESFPASTFNLEVEQHLLGAAMTHGLDRLGVLRPDHFYDGLHQRLYAAMERIYRDGGQVSPAVLKSQFVGDADLEKVGGPVYLARLKAEAIGVNPFQYAKVIIELARRRHVLAVCQAGARTVADPYSDGTVDDIASTTISGLTDVLAEGPQGHPRVAGDLMPVVIATAEARQSGARLPTTGLAALDQRLGGWAPGNQVFLAGRPAMGKSALGLWLALFAARRNNFSVAFFSLEMTAEECMVRLACAVASSGQDAIAYEDVRSGKVTREHLARLEAVRAKIEGVDLFIDEQPRRSVQSIMAECRNIQREAERKGSRLGLVVVDHLRKVADSGNYKNNPNKSEGEKAAMLKDMAKQLGVTVLTLVQLNRGVEGREDKHPTLSDLRDSGEIEEEADAVCMVYREAYYREREKPPKNAAEEADWRAEMEEARSIAEVIISKNRHGQTGNIKIACDMASNRFWDMEGRI